MRFAMKIRLDGLTFRFGIGTIFSARKDSSINFTESPERWHDKAGLTLTQMSP